MTDPQAATPPPATILIVDDNPVNLQILVRTLSGTGHRILAARDGSAALDIVARARPDLVLLDIMMPGQDGFALCRTIKGDPRTEDTLVIFLSALGQVSDKVLGLNLGAVDYITKPIQTEEVVARVSNHLQRQHLEREVKRGRDRLDRELASAARMQGLLLPSALPTREGLRFAAHYQTSRHAGGDYYDVLEIPGHGLGIFVADVSGHGAPAAIVMAMIRAVVHAQPPSADPAELLRRLNEHFRYLWDTSIFSTALYAVLDEATMALTIGCAGHPPPLLARSRQPVRPLRVDPVLPLFMMETAAVPTTHCQLEPGDRILFYTDGVTDRLREDGTMYDLERLCAELERAAAKSAGAIIAELVDSLDVFASEREPDDDQTLLVLAVGS
jgi:sigma-B regulation protein RsbU (phosphoserine phosphatase)